MMKVDRISPVVVLPKTVFSPYAPYALATSKFSSLARGKGSEFVSAKPSWEETLSGETPSTAAFMETAASRKSQACVVQPGVLSFG